MKKNTILIIAIIFVVVIFVGLDYLNKKAGFRNIKENFYDINDDKTTIINELKNSKLEFELIDNTNWLSSKNIKNNISFYIDNEANIKGDIYNGSVSIINFKQLSLTNNSIQTNNDNTISFIELKPISQLDNIIDIRIIRNNSIANLLPNEESGNGNYEIIISYRNSGSKTYYNTTIEKTLYDSTTDNIIELNEEDDNTRLQYYKIFLLKQLSVNKNNNIYHLSLKFIESNNTDSFYGLYGSHMEIYFNNVLDNDKIKDNSFEKNICTIEYTENDKIKKLNCYFTITINATNSFDINIYNINNDELVITLFFTLKKNNYITKLVDDNKNFREIVEFTESFGIKLNNISQVLNKNYSIRTISFSAYTTDELNEYNKNISTTLENSVYTDMYKLNRDYKRLENEYDKLNEYYILRKNLEKNYLNLKKI